jgi:hypothetical protein
MIKETKVFYPHIVKQYDDNAQLISENNYDTYYSLMRTILSDNGIDLTDNTKYKEDLTTDKFEGKITIVYPNNETMTAIETAIGSQMSSFSDSQPIFEEFSDNHLF